MSQLVRVTWKDSWLDSGQISAEEFKNEYLIQTTGWMVRQTEEVISIAAEKHPDDDYRIVTHIPTVCVLQIEALSGGV